MDQVFTWTVTVENTDHEVSCTDKGNKFDLFVDGDYRYSVPIDRNLDLEENVTIGGKRCRFVVYGGVPDLAVDGILLNAEADLLKEELKSRRLGILAGVFLLVMGTLAIYSWLLLLQGGETYIGGLLAPLFALAFIVLGVLQILRMRKRRPV